MKVSLQPHESHIPFVLQVREMEGSVCPVAAVFIVSL